MAMRPAISCCRDWRRRIKNLIRSSDMFCRLSGDEFVVVMPDTRLDVAAKVAERIRAGIAIEGFSLANSRDGAGGDDFGRARGKRR